MSQITAWRLVKPAFAKTAYNGEGARRFGGRWNPIGYAVAYASDSRALAALEMLVHVRDVRLLEAYLLVPCSFEDTLVEKHDAGELPAGWGSRATPGVAQEIGARWLEESRSAVLSVPSVVLPAERNYLFNPAHPRFGECEVGEAEPFELDARLT